MINTRPYVLVACVAAFLQVGCELAPTAPQPFDRNADVSIASLFDKEVLGKLLFFDKNLSLDGNQSCATCHAPEWGFTGPDAGINAHGAVYEGSIAGAFGDRKPPSSAYATQSPILYQAKDGAWIGGSFWDGRATGWSLGSPAAEQAKGPFLNPKEQALPDADALVARVASSDYAGLFRAVWGQDAFDDVPEAYNKIAFSIAAYEASAESNAFTSRFDAWLKGKARLSGEEARGWALFKGKAKCVNCHIVKGKKPLFTDYTYDNLGIPSNPENPAFVADPNFRDPGLGGFLRAMGYPYEQELGKHKVPTLRNVDLRPAEGDTKAYGHNGYFKSLKDIVHFYNTRDVASWPAPEVLANMNTTELGNLGLTEAEEDAIVAFLKTLSDGYMK